MSGSKVPSSLTAMESQLKKNEKEVANLEQQYNEVINKMSLNQTDLEFAKGTGDTKQVSLLTNNQSKLDNQSIILATQLENVRDKAEKLRKSLEELKINPQSSIEAQNLKAKIGLATSSLEESKKETNELAKNIERVGNKRFKGFGIDTSSINEGFKQVNSKIDKFKSKMSRLISTALIFNLIRKGLTNLANGFTSLLKSNDTFSDSLNQIKANLMTAFAPIYNSILPAINTLMNALSRITGTIASFTASLFGQTADQAKENAKQLYNQANAQKAVNEAQESLASFDKLEVNGDDSKGSNSSGNGGIDFSGTPEVDPNLLNFFNKIKELASQIRFDGFISGLQDLWKSLQPFAQNVGSGLFWFVENVLIPLANWTINDLIPSFFNILGGALDIVNQAIADLTPIWEWFWQNVLSPLIEFTGGIIVDVLNGIGDALSWISQNEFAMTLLESLAIAIGLVSTALGIYHGVMVISEAVTNLFSKTMDGLTKNSTIALVTLAITALIAIIKICIDHWDEISAAAGKCWEWIVGVWNGAKQWFNDHVVQPIKDLIGGLWNNLTDGARQALEGVKNIFSGLASFFGSIFSKAWQTVKNVFSTGGKVFDGIKDGIINAFKAVVNALIKGINKVVSMPFNGLNNILQKIHDVSFLGISPFSWLTWRAPVPEIPYLAQGAVIPPNKKFTAVLGDQTHGTNLEAPESLIRKIVREESGEKEVILNATFIIQAETGEEFGRATLNGLHLLQDIDGKTYVLN